jgi:hypothetical protein
MLLKAAARERGIQMACTVAWQSTAGSAASDCCLAAVAKAINMCCTASWDALRPLACKWPPHTCCRAVSETSSSRRVGARDVRALRLLILPSSEPGDQVSNIQEPLQAGHASCAETSDAWQALNPNAMAERLAQQLGAAAGASARLGKWVPPVRATIACTTLHVCLQRLSTMVTRMLA